ncbi:hypothetical protein NliqN6_3902 [Naganishia liquefaciens]|uniref:Uncharacterized protein n=1 Tax=Naganishia liquefaciens TaxID=104408 RepID=A0A8H3TUJ9_9TREE|nr:hypothetical protein NliqN6_3902 [Naganishia liquefaciens]
MTSSDSIPPSGLDKTTLRLMNYWQRLCQGGWEYASWMDSDNGKEGWIKCKYPSYYTAAKEPVYAGGCLMMSFGALPKWIPASQSTWQMLFKRGKRHDRNRIDIDACKMFYYTVYAKIVAPLRANLGSLEGRHYKDIDHLDCIFFRPYQHLDTEASNGSDGEHTCAECSATLSSFLPSWDGHSSVFDSATSFTW